MATAGRPGSQAAISPAASPAPTAGGSPAPTAGASPTPTAGASHAPTAGQTPTAGQGAQNQGAGVAQGGAGFRPRAPGVVSGPTTGMTGSRPGTMGPTAGTPGASPVVPGPSAARSSVVPPAAGSRPIEEPPRSTRAPAIAAPTAPAVDEGNIDDWPTQSIDDLVLAPTMTQLHQALETQSTNRPGTQRNPEASKVSEGAAPASPAASPSGNKAIEAALGSSRVWLVPSPEGLRVVSGQRSRPEGAIEAVIVAAAGAVEAFLK